jgi:hypothetical protein
MRGIRIGSGLAAAGACAALLSGCQGDPLDVDGVLWRQVVLEHKDPFLAAVRDSLGSEHEDFAANARRPDGSLGGLRWAEGEPAPSSLASGGLVIWDVEDSPDRVTFSVLIASGPRDAEGDPLASDDERTAPYWGPDAVYTCFGIEAQFTERLFSSYGIDDSVQCAAELAASLGDADPVPIAAFAG